MLDPDEVANNIAEQMARTGMFNGPALIGPTAVQMSELLRGAPPDALRFMFRTLVAPHLEQATTSELVQLRELCDTELQRLIDGRA